MASKAGWAGWVAFAGLMMIIIGAIDFFEGLIALIRGRYYAVTPSQIIVFDTTTWGWITLLMGIAVFFTGIGLLGMAGWARWLAIILVAVNLIEQLGWLGHSAYPLWTLVVVTLQIIVLFALTARWSEAREAQALG